MSPLPIRLPRQSLRPVRAGIAAAALVALVVSPVAPAFAEDLPPAFDQAGQVAAADQIARAAVRETILRGNEEQIRAFSTGDTSVMADTSTPDYLQRMAQVNQSLAQQGVASIALLRLQWGSVAISGSTATAATYETWRTVFQDGTVQIGRDLNQYQLVQSGSTWLVAADAHPGNPPAAPTAPGSPATPPTPLPGGTSISTNWSGYTATGGTFTAVSGSWTVPQPAADAGAGADAAWVGIGGIQGTDLIQAGTEESISPRGTVLYQAWIETLPRAADVVPLTVHPGDSMTVSLVETGTDTWSVTLTDSTTGQQYARTVTYHSSLSSAEWIEESPSNGRGMLPLDSFGQVTFTGATATRDGQQLDLAGLGATPVTMVGPGQQPIAVPGPIQSDSQSFAVTQPSAQVATGSGPAALPR